MPKWPASLCTHWQMYEGVTEGTPISPVCSSPEGLARWLADPGSNAFSDTRTTYQEWLWLILQESPYSGVVTSEGTSVRFAFRASNLK
jgi:hypothetical protein